MRRLAILAALLHAAVASADTGVSFEETVSGVGYGGDLASYGDSSTRFTFGVVIRQDERALNIVGGCLVDEVSVAWGEGAYCFGGFDLRRTWQLNHLSPHKPRRAGFGCRSRRGRATSPVTRRWRATVVPVRTPT
jgi:hypothetical protein